jgi:predicted amidohydrolase YtcJ
MKILHNAHIHTLDPNCPVASVIVIERERVLAVGGPDLLESFPQAGRQDMGGRVILPGLTDAHLHLEKYALSLQKLDLNGKTDEECARLVSEHIARPAEWILGHGWSGVNPLFAGLGGENPVYLTARSLHAAWANASALRMAGIGPGTPDPLNGKILRDETGLPNGILLEGAVALVEKIIPQPSLDAVSAAIEAAQPLLWKMGLTGVHDFDGRASFMALQALDLHGRLKLRVLKSIPLALLPEAHALGLRSGFGSDYLRIGSVKVFMDGTLGQRTAAMLQPYSNEPENRGMLNMDSEALAEHGRQAADVGLSVAVHAIGDRAVHETLNAFEQVRSYERERHLPALRHRIEHVQLTHSDDAARLGQMGIVASMQPIHAISDMTMADAFWGERARLAYGWRTQANHGASLAFGSDAPVESPNPFWGLHAAVTRRRFDGTPGPDGWYPEERLSIQSALQGYTIGAAYAAGMEDRLGRLAPGYYADLIVLENDPFACPPETLRTLGASATMLAGEWLV